jgi:hypothetical protein
MTNTDNANLNWIMANENPSKLDMFSSSDLIMELGRRGYTMSGIHDKDEMKKCMTKAFNAICWDNWEDEETGQPDKLGHVYYCKLDWIKETLEEDDEMYSIIEDLQETICPILNLLDNE